MRTVINGSVPSDYRKQVQWGLHICEREWCDFISYCPAIIERPLMIIKVDRDEKLIKEMDAEADLFIAEMLELVRKVRG